MSKDMFANMHAWIELYDAMDADVDVDVQSYYYSALKSLISL